MKQTILFLAIITSFQLSLAQDAKSVVNKLLNQWHTAASQADFNSYFNFMDHDFIFIGTDATERWNKSEFMHYAKPHFDQGKAWSFTALERNINFSADGKTAWIDELLSTQMKLCRGSGVLEQKEGKWLIKQYVLSMTVPNDQAAEVIKLKSAMEDPIINRLKNKQ